MAIKKNEGGTFVLENPAFAGVEFADRRMYGQETVLDLVGSASNGFILQSVKEAVACSLEGHRFADHELTRTGALYFRLGDKSYVAFDDVANSKENLIFMKSQNTMSAGGRFKSSVSMNDSLVRSLLARAEKTGRIVEVSDNHWEAVFTKKYDNRLSEFALNSRIKAIFGDMAESCSELFRRERGCGYGVLLSLDQKALDNLGVGGDVAELRCVTINHGGGCVIDPFCFVSAENSLGEMRHRGEFRFVRGVNGLEDSILKRES